MTVLQLVARRPEMVADPRLACFIQSLKQTNKQKKGHESQWGPKPRTILPVKATNTLLLCTESDK
jgi:hypothetical protein